MVCPIRGKLGPNGPWLATLSSMRAMTPWHKEGRGDCRQRATKAVRTVVVTC